MDIKCTRGNEDDKGFGDNRYTQKNQDNRELRDNQDNPETVLDVSRQNLKADCGNCFGLCCVALYFAASEGFPNDKKQGQPMH